MQHYRIKKIDALTSLRFFAVAMIVLHHSVGHFGIVREMVHPFALDHAVSFFFILSGFVLTYVYGDLRGWAACRRFFIARFARLYPGYLVTWLFFLLVILPPNGFFANPHYLSITWANLFLIQSWVPIADYFTSLNPPTWCVSVEFFFYLIFPLLICKWRQNWWVKSLIALIILFLMVEWTGYLQLPPVRLTQTRPCIEGMVYINPLARTFEFLLGMGVCTLWLKNNLVGKHGVVSATVIEIAVLSLTVFSIYYTPYLLYYHLKNLVGPIWETWLYHTISAPAIAILIFFMASQKGLLTKILNWRFLVILGEMSYAVFLSHYILIYLYNMYIESRLPAQRMVDYPIFWILLLVVSYLFWCYVEEPARHLIPRLFDGKMAIKPSADL